MCRGLRERFTQTLDIQRLAPKLINEPYFGVLSSMHVEVRQRTIETTTYQVTVAAVRCVF